KEIDKPITPPSKSGSEKDSDPEQAQRDKDMLKNLALIAKYFQKIYKPTNNNLKTSSNSRNKNVDTSLRYKNENQTGQFRNHRTLTVAGARETVGSQVVQKTMIQCFICKEFGHFAKECRKPKKVKDSTYHKEKMLLCKQAEKGVPLQAEQSNWLADTDEEIDKQELKAHYNYMEKIQEVPTTDSGTDIEPLEQVQNDAEYNVFANVRQHSEQPESTSNTCLVEKDDSNVTSDSPDLCDNDIQTDQNAEDKHAALPNSIRDSCLIALQNKQTEFKRCLMPLAIKTQNDSFTFVHELKQEMHTDLKYVESLENDIDELESEKAEFSNTYDILLQEYVSNDVIFAKLEKHSISLELALQQCQEQMKNDTVCKEKASNVFLKEREQYFEIQDLKAQLQDKNIAISELKKLIKKCEGKSMETKFDKPSVVRQPNAQRILKPSVLGKPTPFSDSLERNSVSKTKSVSKTNVLEGLSKPVTIQILP
ncbi:retrovirus-related pol polyprotein from transposon TNT 1-94, partial [Tanacetum coccineum]